MCCIYQTISKRRWVDKLRIKLDARTEVALTAKGFIEYKLYGEAPYMLFMPGSAGFVHTSTG
jgi:hypothetical protein